MVLPPYHELDKQQLLPKPTKLSLAVAAASAEMSQPPEEPALIPRLSEHFGRLDDPREEELVEHKLLDMIVMAVCAVICGAGTWVEVETVGKASQAWLESFLDLPHGIASHDIFGRLFARLSSHQFQGCFASWIKAVFTVSSGQVIAIDGKTGSVIFTAGCQCQIQPFLPSLDTRRI